MTSKSMTIILTVTVLSLSRCGGGGSGRKMTVDSEHVKGPTSDMNSYNNPSDADTNFEANPSKSLTDTTKKGDSLRRK
ncbi:MAG TPA: hypothetical protein VNU72_04700 [Puia sp.]|nr:hypothetical protein [Puia sp.]